MTTPDQARAVAVRVDRLLDQLRNGPDPRAALVAEELVRGLVQLYGAGLERIVAMVGPQRSRELCADPLVESLLLVHDLHPLDADTRVRRALDRLGRAGGAGSAGAAGLASSLLAPGDARYDGIDGGGVARVRLASGSGCRSSARAAIESAIREAAPEVTDVVVEIEPAPPPLLSISRRPGSEAVR
jgi:hypothetical protein